MIKEFSPHVSGCTMMPKFSNDSFRMNPDGSPDQGPEAVLWLEFKCFDPHCPGSWAVRLDAIEQFVSTLIHRKEPTDG